MQQFSMKSAKQLLDVIVSICLVCVTIAILAVTVDYYRSRKSASIAATADTKPTLYKGESLRIDSIRKTSPNQRILLVALRPGCKYCAESAPLYKELVSRSKSMNARLSFVFAEPVREAKSYLQANGIESSDVQQVDFKSIDVSGTPTMVLLDANDRVSDFWIGEIRDAGKEQFLNSLGLSEEIR